MNEEDLYKLWKKYININLYRITSSEHLNNILKNGLNPKKNPYQKLIPDIKKLFKLVLKLERKGFIHEQDWGFKKVTGKYIVAVSSEDINSHFIDFTPNYKETHYYKRHKGGALAQTVERITDDILNREPALSEKEISLIMRLHKWSKKKSKFSNKILFVKGSSIYFESALFQNRLGEKAKDKYWKSPFGRLENFKKIIGKFGLKRYEPYLKGEKLFYLRTIGKIPPKEIYKVV
ncbi:hypothetical protein HYX08_03870 [Candidatus Woesearchaeota archaeon]|nr:hypothetical protein [Candidatus Woesearchaeota archaeon]